MKLAQAKALADDWAWEKQLAHEEAALCSYYNHASPHQLIAMWTSGKSLKGKPLTQWETQALVEAWCRVFNAFPPNDDAAECSSPLQRSKPTEAVPADDTMLRAKDVVRLTGLSLSTLKRMALDGRFAKPMRLSPHRIGWPAREVRAWLETVEGARHKARR